MSKEIDYSIFYKTKYNTPSEFQKENSYDLFISAYNDSERVRKIFTEANSKEKHWIVFPEYRYAESELPKATLREFDIFSFPEENITESEIIRRYFDPIVSRARTINICIDITGFVRPHLIFLIRYLSKQNFTSIDFIYTDPISYKKKEETDFSSEYSDVRQVEGCQGNHAPDSSNDFLIIGSGYDDKRITDVSKKKASCRKVQLFGLPSLQPDMFQENILKAYKAEEASSSGRENFIDSGATLFAPANDPFVTANVLKEFVEKETKRKVITNLYLCPLSTKAQTLGFALYYISEWSTKSGSIIFPFCSKYSRETTEGIAKIWKYKIDFAELNSVP